MPSPDADGIYTIYGLATGAYQVQFSAPMGSDLVSEFFRDTTDYSAATPVTVTGDNTTTASTPSRPPAASHRRVSDSNGTPIANISVYVTRASALAAPTAVPSRRRRHLHGFSSRLG